MIRWIIIAAFAFTIGNIVWPMVGKEGDPRLFFIPLAVMILLLFVYARHTIAVNQPRWVRNFIDYFVVLAAGNVIKQMFYSEKMKQINDYYFGGLMTLVLIITLWVNRKKK